MSMYSTDIWNWRVAFIKTERQNFPQIIREHVSPRDGEQVSFPQEIDRRVSEATSHNLNRT